MKFYYIFKSNNNQQAAHEAMRNLLNAIEIEHVTWTIWQHSAWKKIRERRAERLENTHCTVFYRAHLQFNDPCLWLEMAK